MSIMSTLTKFGYFQERFKTRLQYVNEATNRNGFPPFFKLDSFSCLYYQHQMFYSLEKSFVTFLFVDKNYIE